MTSIGLRPALVLFSFAGLNVRASISARKLSNGTTRSIISSGSPFAEITASRLSASKKPNWPIVPTSPNPIVTVRLAQIQEGRYFSKCPVVFALDAGFDPYSFRFSNGPGSIAANAGVPQNQQTAYSDSSRAGQWYNGIGYVGVSSPTYCNAINVVTRFHIDF